MAHPHTRNWLVDRRRLLRGAGVTLALPLLECMRPGLAQSTPERCARCVFVYVPNGVNMPAWQIRTSGAGYELTAPLLPLAPHRSQLTALSGLHHPHGLGRAHQVDRIWLTGARIDPGGAALRNSVSADQLMAEVAGVHTRVPSLEIALTGRTLAWSRDGVPLPAERKPAAIFDRLFGVEPGGEAAARRRLDRRASVLDAVLADARELRHRLGSEDRSKLDEYLSAVREVELRTARAGTWLDAERPAVDPELARRLTREVPDSAAGSYYDTVFDLIALALRTDVTRVVTCMLGSESDAFALPEIGIPKTRHELSHHNGDPENMRALTRADTFLVERLARFLDQLSAHEEGGQPLLDRTMVLFGSGMAYGHGHGNANLPLILAGGRTLGLRHGRHVDFNLPAIGAYDLDDPRAYDSLCLRPVDGDARLCNLLLTMLRCMGVETEAFGDSLRPLSEIEA